MKKIKILIALLTLFTCSIAFALVNIEPYGGFVLGTRSSDSFARYSMMDEGIGSLGVGIRAGIEFMNVFLNLDGLIHKTNIFDSVNKS